MKLHKGYKYFFKRLVIYSLVLVILYACFACVVQNEENGVPPAQNDNNESGNGNESPNIGDGSFDGGDPLTGTLSDGTPLYLANSIGNSAANLASGGKMAFQGGFCYYSNESDANCLYKRTETQNIKLCDMSCSQINVLGENVYFLTYPFSKELYRVPINGGKAERVNNKRCDNLIAAQNCLYYCDASDSYRIRKLNLAANEDIGLDAVNAMYVHYYNGEIYYQVYKNNSYKLMRLSADGKSEEQICDLKQNCQAIAFEDDRIYYRAVVSVSGNTKYRIYTMKTDGSDNKLLSANEPLFLNIANGKLYYSNCDDNYYLYSINLDGTSSKKVHSYATEYVFSDGRNIYTKSFSPDQNYILIS